MANLLEILKLLIPCIEGPYFVADGALLGIVREQKLLEHDNDVDIYLLPGTTIDLSKSLSGGIGLKEQQYYMDKKIYHPNNKKNKLNKWNEYLSYRRATDCNGLNRCQLYIECKEDYKNESIAPKFTTPYIDIYHLSYDNDKYKISTRHWNQYYYKEEDIFPLVENNDLGFSVLIPNQAEAILKRNYGENCLSVVDKKWKWIKKTETSL